MPMISGWTVKVGGVMYQNITLDGAVENGSALPKFSTEDRRAILLALFEQYPQDFAAGSENASRVQEVLDHLRG